MVSAVTVAADGRANLVIALTDHVTPIPVFAYQPPHPIVPCVFIDVVGRRRETLDGGGTVIVLTYPVVAVVDGTNESQIATLDELGDQIWTAIESINGRPLEAAADTVDVGGPRVRMLTTIAAQLTMPRTLCAATAEYLQTREVIS
jgi:hypothetical protein